MLFSRLSEAAASFAREIYKYIYNNLILLSVCQKRDEIFSNFNQMTIYNNHSSLKWQLLPQNRLLTTHDTIVTVTSTPTINGDYRTRRSDNGGLILLYKAYNLIAKTIRIAYKAFSDPHQDDDIL